MITNIFQFLKLINQKTFLIFFCKVNPLSGINHRIINKPSNKTNYHTDLRDADKIDLRKGLKELSVTADRLSKLPDDQLFKREK